jgi:hypothetical protein
METLLFAVGIVIFMITVYGTVMAGGEMLKRKQVENLADDVKFVTDDSGLEYMVGNKPAESPRSS